MSTAYGISIMLSQTKVRTPMIRESTSFPIIKPPNTLWIKRHLSINSLAADRERRL
jgi:hypothetical protein